MPSSSKRNINILFSTSLVATLFLIQPAFAQDVENETEKSEIAIDEIVVTAQRRKQKIEEVPISITAFTAADLQKENIRGIEDYLGKTANVNFAEGGSGRQSNLIGIRGVSNIGGLSDAFTVYVDEFSGNTANPNIYDAERVEVLRGPQGTYFGRNSTGGAINITTNKPSGEFAGQVQLGYASFNTLTAQGFINAPITDTFFVRLTGDFERSDGFVKNLNPTGSQPDIQNYTGRLQVRYKPNDKLTVDLQGVYEKEKIGLFQSIPTGILDPNASINFAILGLAQIRADGIPDLGIQGNPSVPSLPGVYQALTGEPLDQGSGFYPANRNRLNVNSPERNDDKRTTFIGKIAYDIDFATIYSVTGYQQSKGILQRDTDGSALDIGRDTISGKSTTFTQEVRLNSTSSNTFNWTIGAFYANSKSISDQVIAVSPILAENLGVDTFVTSLSSVNSRSLAAFAEVSYVPIERLTATLGVRYTNDKVRTIGETRSLSGIPDFSDVGSILDFIDNGLMLGPSVSFATPSVTFNDVSPRLALTYEFDNSVNAYATVSNGYKAGGNQASPEAILAGIDKFKPEDIWNYEIGFKGRVFDNTLQFGIAAFYADWKNLQTTVEVLNIASTFNITGNAASARNYGIEADFSWATPLKGLRIDGSVGYLNAKFKSFKNAQLGNFNDQCRVTVGQAPVAGGARDCDLSGQKLPLASKWTVSLGAEYAVGLTDNVDAFIGGDMSYRSSTSPSLTLFALGGANGTYPYATSPYTVFNLRAGIDAGRWRIDAYAQNILNKNYFTTASASGAIDGYRVTPSPRVIGVRAAVDF